MATKQRDLIGYGNKKPNPSWPNEAKLAVQFVLNYEEGGENSFDNGDKYLRGFDTPSRKLEFFSSTISDWGWEELCHVVPWQLKSHVHRDNIDTENGQMLLLPNFRLPTLIHTRSANAKWLYEIRESRYHFT